MSGFRYLLLTTFLVTYAWSASAETFYRAVQPVLPKAQVEKAYAPLASYLSQATGHDIKIKASMNFLGYWETMRRSKDIYLFLNAAHFTDYRVK